MTPTAAVETLLLELISLAWRLDRDEDVTGPVFEDAAQRAISLAEAASEIDRARLGAAVARVGVALSARRSRITTALDKMPLGRRAVRKYQTPEPQTVSDRDARWVRRVAYGGTHGGTQ